MKQPLKGTLCGNSTVAALKITPQVKKYLSILLLLISGQAMAQQIDRPNTIDLFEIESEFLKESRTIKVSLPYDYAKSTKSYPIILVLDNQLMFSTMTAMVNQLSAVSRIPESLVVTITEGTKHRTHYAPNLYSNSNERAYGYGNHQKEFTQFLQNELLPKLDANYRTVNFRTLVGFSPSSIFTLHTLLKSPDLFQAYIAIAAGNIIGDGYKKGESFIDIITNFSIKDALPNAYLYVVSGGGDLDNQPHIRANVDGFNQNISTFSNDNFKAKAEIIDGEGHTDVLLPGIISAMDFIFPKEKWFVDYVDLINTSRNPKENIDDFYNALSLEYGFTVYPNMDRLYSMSCIKNVGSRLLREDRFNEAIELYQYWTDLYPQSAKAHAYLGYAQKHAENFKASRVSYEKAVAIAKKESNPQVITYQKALDELKTSTNRK
ncbi:MAG: alpha/beta hydrolase-fold protein [Bacteroidota bacterium]